MIFYLIFKFFLKSLHLCLLLSTLSSHPGSTCNAKNFTSSFNYQSFSPVFPQYPPVFLTFFQHFVFIIWSFYYKYVDCLSSFLLFSSFSPLFAVVSHLFSLVPSCSSVFLFSFFLKSFIWCAQNWWHERIKAEVHCILGGFLQTSRSLIINMKLFPPPFSVLFRLWI